MPLRFPCAGARALWAPTRRDFLYGLGASLGSVALTSLLAEQAPVRAASKDTDPLAPRPAPLPARAKACIFLMMEGGPSHIDTFDPKPKLAELHMQEFQRSDQFASMMSSGKRYYIQSPFHSRQVGDAGLWMCDRFEHLLISLAQGERLVMHEDVENTSLEFAI